MVSSGKSKSPILGDVFPVEGIAQNEIVIVKEKKKNPIDDWPWTRELIGPMLVEWLLLLSIDSDLLHPNDATYEKLIVVCNDAWHADSFSWPT